MKYTLILFIVLITLIYLLSDLSFSNEENELIPNNLSGSLATPAKQNKIPPIMMEVTNKSPATVIISKRDEQQILKEENYTDNVENSNISQENVYLQFKDQEVDYEWAPEFTDKLYDFFSTNEELIKLNIKEIECRESLCHLQLYVKEVDSIEQAQIIGKAMKSGDWKEHSFYFSSHPEPGVMKIEIGRFKEN